MKQKANKLTNTDINLSQSNLVRNLVHGCQTRGALTVDGVEGRGVGDASSEGGHTSDACTSSSGEDVSDDNVFDQNGVDGCFLVSSLENGGEEFFRSGVLETTLLSLDSNGLS